MKVDAMEIVFKVRTKINWLVIKLRENDWQRRQAK